MAKRRLGPEQIVTKLRQVEVLQSRGESVWRRTGSDRQMINLALGVMLSS